MDYLFIDLSSIAYPMWHTSQDHPDPNETSTRVLGIVRALATARGPNGTAVCCDGGRSFRVDLDPTYKGNREEQDMRLGYQIARTRDLLVGEGFPVWRAPTFEADDVIASATARALQDPEAKVTIATVDKDLLQLVGDRVTVHSVLSGADLDATAVKAKFGVWPDQIVDYLSLVGDASDNIHGAPRCGPKTAAALLDRYTALEAIYERLNANGELPGATRAQRAGLIEFATRWPIVRTLLTLRTDVPIAFEDILRDRQTEEEVMTNGRSTEDSLQDYQDPSKPVTEEPHRGDIEQIIPHGADANGVKAIVKTLIGLPDAPVLQPATKLPLLAPAASEIVLPQSLREWERQLEPTSMSEAKALAADLFTSRLFSAYGHPAAVLSTILAGRELGLPAMASLRAFHIIEGKPTLTADFMRALVLRSGLAEFFHCIERTELLCTFQTKRKGVDATQSLTYRISDAKIAWPRDERAWQTSGWTRHPADMLVARAGSKLARLVYPDVLHGLYCPEEFD